MQLMHNATRKLQVWNQLLIAGKLPEHTPAAYLVTLMHFYDQAPRPPPLIKSPNKGAIRLGLS